MMVRIRRCSKPYYWYMKYVGFAFPVNTSLFGYKVDRGEHKGKLIYLKDCEVIDEDAIANAYTLHERGWA